MDDERAAREALRRGANPSFVDRAREEAARAGARDDAGARTTTKVRRHRAGKSVEARDEEEEEEEEEEDALGFAKPSAAGTRGRAAEAVDCLLYTSPSPRDQRGSRMPSSA